MLGNYYQNDSSDNDNNDDLIIVNNSNKLELDNDLLISTSQIDYQNLYLKEVLKNIELEHIIQNLNFELSLYKDKEKLETNEIVSNDDLLFTSLVRDDLSDNDSFNDNKSIPTSVLSHSEMSKLEREEKDRRQKQRYMRVKSQKRVNIYSKSNNNNDNINDSIIVTANIHQNIIPDSNNNNNSTMLAKDCNVIPSESLHSQQKQKQQDFTDTHQFNNNNNINTVTTSLTKPNSSWQWEADDSEEEENTASIITKHIDFIPPAFEIFLTANTTAMNDVSNKSVDDIIDKVCGKYSSQKELAAIDRQRRAQNIHRNVRNSGSRQLQQQQHPQTNRSISPIPNSFPMKSTAIAETIPIYNSTSSFVDKHKYEESSESDDWDSSDKEEINYNNINSNDRLLLNSNNNIYSNSCSVDDLDQQLDIRIKEWVRGKDIVAMLRSISAVSLANRMMFEDKGIYTAVSKMSNEPSEIRKIYLKIIRYCHPDKQTHLDTECLEFLELKKIFTVLSDTYNHYKASMT